MVSGAAAATGDDLQARRPERRPRPRTNPPQTWDHLETISVKLNQVLQDLFENMRQPSQGGLAPEFSISLVADLAELPPAIKAPARQNPVSLRGRTRIVVGGRVDAHAVFAKVEIVARAIVYGLPGEDPPAGMSRNTWFLPLESGEKQKDEK
jgi:hypothetical protein